MIFNITIYYGILDFVCVNRLPNRKNICESSYQKGWETATIAIVHSFNNVFIKC